MSNISRRSFLKGAGAAALAVAAAGVLAGCSKDEAEREVKLKYLDTKAGKVLGDVIIKVPVLTKTVSFATILENKPAAAEGYDFESTEDKEIPNTSIVTVKMVKKVNLQPVEIGYKLVDYGAVEDLPSTSALLDGAKLKIDVVPGTTKIATEGLLPANSALAICDVYHMPTVEGLVNGAVENGIATVYVYKK